ncbi:hypothetical protein VU01_10282 [Candidatus Electrothrix marina]|uniref:Uncharacterized protein n=1 Tax=Candidatus Electrothrix marina TaxID=1859130 RepID=A0A444JGH5_9BACT|nr:hypothetical protein VU01_10282 [Candidatus Electrothrix marina]
MVLSGLGADVTVNFMDSGSYNLFIANLLSYGRYMLEVCDRPCHNRGISGDHLTRLS